MSGTGNKEMAEIIRNLATEAAGYILLDVTGKEPSIDKINQALSGATKDSTVGRAMRLIDELEQIK